MNWILYKALSIAIWETEKEIKILEYRENEYLLPDWYKLKKQLESMKESEIVKILIEAKKEEANA
jgi:hypothetical protein